MNEVADFSQHQPSIGLTKSEPEPEPEPVEPKLFGDLEPEPESEPKINAS